MVKKHSTSTYSNDFQKYPFVQKMLAGMSAQTAATFTDVQLAELNRVLKKRVSNSSAVDMRLSIPFFQRRFYLVLLMGREKRSLERLKKSNFQIINDFLATLYILSIISLILGGIFVERELRINSFPYNDMEKVRESFNEHQEI